MLAKGYCAESASDCLGIDLSTVYRYWDFYSTEGLDFFLENKHKGYWSLPASQQLSQLCAELRRTLYTVARSVSVWIEDHFGVVYTVSTL